MTTRAALNPGDPGNPTQALYLRNNSTQTYQSLTADLPGVDRSMRLEFEAVNADGQAVVFRRVQEGPFGSTPSPFHEIVYVGDAGGTQPVSVLTDGSLIPGHVASIRDYATDAPAQNAVSRDGARVYWNESTGFESPLYLRDFSGEVPETIPVSVSEREGSDKDQVHDAELEAASPDGLLGLFRAGGPLTDESVGGASLYLWNRDAAPDNRLTDLTTTDPEGAGDD